MQGVEHLGRAIAVRRQPGVDAGHHHFPERLQIPKQFNQPSVHLCPSPPSYTGHTKITTDINPLPLPPCPVKGKRRTPRV